MAENRYNKADVIYWMHNGHVTNNNEEMSKFLAEGGYEESFRQTFETVPEEQLQNSFACYLSTLALKQPVFPLFQLSRHVKKGAARYQFLEPWTLQVEEVFYLLKYQLGKGFRGMRKDNKKGPSGKEMGQGIKRQNLAFEGEAVVPNKRRGDRLLKRRVLAVEREKKARNKV